MIASIIANGTVNDGTWLKRHLKGVIIAADGGANTCRKQGIVPDYIVGDFDSAKPETLEFFKKKSTILQDSDQNSTDLQKALKLAAKLKATNILVFGAIGNNLDHTMSNVLSLNTKCAMLDERHEIYVVEKKIAVSGKPGDIVSIIALTDVAGMTYAGLHWPVKHLNVPAGWNGSRNRLEKKKAVITLKRGKIAVMKVKL
ncbi:MAG: thiamine diphosphokinase [Nanoarchaeota archaeon]|nr:thiamine diphosphokinase [Nanoarchaeota archaeon]